MRVPTVLAFGSGLQVAPNASAAYWQMHAPSADLQMYNVHNTYGLVYTISDSIKLFSFNRGVAYPYVAKTATYAIVDADYTIDCTANTFTTTLPTAVGRAGQVYVVKNSGAGTITVATTSSQTIDGATTKTLAAAAVLRVQSTNANWIII